MNKSYHPSLILLTILISFSSHPAFAQPITPAHDGTGTIIRQQGNQYQIEGGSFSQDRQNLFHSFQEFNLPAGQTANFLAQPQLQNILGKVTGGNASLINGLIQVTGGQANLFLINPAGVIFGPQASLNLPNAFHVSTATGLGFANNQWLNVLRSNNYATLLGTPENFAFSLSQSGVIVNQADLQVNPGEHLSLLGGMVLNTGKLTSHGGNITVAAVPAGNMLEISQPGHLLSLQVKPLGTVAGLLEATTTIQPLSLPALLTGNNSIEQANNLMINQSGQVVLTSTNIAINEKSGTAINAGNIDVSHPLGKGGDLQILGDRIGVINSHINASGEQGGGTVLIGGDWQGKGKMFRSQQTLVNENSLIEANAIQSGDGGKVIIWSDGQTNFVGNLRAIAGQEQGNGGLVEISGKQDLVFRGKVDVTAINGEIGTILFDPENITIDQVIDDQIDEQTANAPQQRELVDPLAMDGDYNITIDVNNINNIQGIINLQADNDITVNQPINTNKSVELTAGRSININADIDTSTGNGNISLFGNSDVANINNRGTGAANIRQLDGTTLKAGTGNITLQLGDLGQVGNIYLANLASQGTVTVNANTGNILATSANSLINAGNLALDTEKGGIGSANTPLNIEVDNLRAIAGQSGLFINANKSVSVSTLETKQGGDINLNITGDLTVNDHISSATDNNRDAGDITITSTGKINSQSASITSNSVNGKAGSIQLTADQNIITRDVAANAGKITLTADDLGNTITVVEGGAGNAGNINLTAGNSINTTVGEVSAYSVLGNGGNINLTAQGNIKAGDIKSTTGYEDSVSYELIGNGNSGNITLTSQTGVINTEQIISNAILKNSGDITITAKKDVIINTMTTKANLDSGDIQVNSDNGNINLTNINLSSNNGKAGNLTINSRLGTVNIANDVNGYSNRLNGGNIQITADQDIITAGMNTYSQASNGGNINLLSKQGLINIQGLLDSNASSIGGNVQIKAQGNISTNSIFTRGVLQESGNVTLESQAGTINMREGESLSTVSFFGSAGDINLMADGDIKFSNINAESSAGDRSGNINIKSINGSIDNSTGEGISLSAIEGQAGQVNLEALGTISFGNIQAAGKTQGGTVEIMSEQGGISMLPLGEINTSATAGRGGNIDITGSGLVQIATINATGTTTTGQVNLTSTNNDVNASANNIQGDLTITAYNGNVNLAGPKNLNISDGGSDDLEATVPSKNKVIDGSQINSLSSPTIQLTAQNDININEQIKTKGSVKDLTLQAGRNIRVNADIDTTAGNGNLTLEANLANTENPFRSAGAGNIFMADGTSLKTGRGDINLRLGTAGEIGNITLANLTTTGNVNIKATGGNILTVSPNTLIQANQILLQTTDQGGIGTLTNPLILQVNNLEAIAGTGGIFLTAPTQGLTIGNQQTNELAGIITDGGDVQITVANDLTIREPITTAGSGTVAGNINLKSLTGNIKSFANITSSVRASNNPNQATRSSSSISEPTAGNITLEAAKNIITDNISANAAGNGNSGVVNLIAGGNINTKAGAISSQVVDGQAGEINMNATGNILTGEILSNATGGGNGGSINLTSEAGQINTTAGNILTAAQSGSAGNVIIDAENNISLGGIDSASTGTAGDVTITSQQGSIDATEQINSSSNQRGGNISLNALGDITTTEINTRAAAVMTDGQAGNIALNSETGNITVNDGLYSDANGGTGGDISVTAAGTITTLGEINTFSREENNTTGTGGNITIEAGNAINIEANIKSFALEESGDVTINSESGAMNTQSILTRATNGSSGNIILNTYSQSGDIQTANLTTIGDQAAGQVEVIAADGNIITEDITVESEEGTTGGINLEGNDITTGDQTVISGSGDSTITNTAKGSLFVGNQTAIADQGDANISNTATGNVTVANQTAVTNTGNVTIINTAGGDISTGDQTAITNTGNVTVTNTAGGDISTGDQTAITNTGNVTVTNTAGGNLTTGDQTAITNTGDATLTNTADGNITTGNQNVTANNGNAIINNTAGGILTTGEQNAIAIGGINQIINNAGQVIPGVTPTINNINTNILSNIANNSNPVINNVATTPVSINPSLVPVTVNPSSVISNVSNIPGNITNSNPLIINNPVTTPSAINPINNTLPANNLANQLNPAIANNIPNSIGINNPVIINNPVNNPLITSQPIAINNQINTPTNTQINNQISLQNQGVTLSQDLNVNPFNNSPTVAINNNLSSPTVNTQEQNILQNISNVNTTPLLAANSNTLNLLEDSRTQEFTNYFGKDLLEGQQPTANIRDVLTNIAKQTGHNSAVLYVNAYPEALQIVLYTASGETILKTLPDVDRKKVLKTVNEFRQEILSPRQRQQNLYLKTAQQLYSWLIAPLKADLEKNQVDNILFSLGEGLRGLPLAALHDGEQFLVEKYSLSVIPNLTLIDTNYRSLEKTQVLAMGASEFTVLNKLPAVPVELKTIAENLWSGQDFLNEEFTLSNLVKQRQSYPYEIIHLATHAEFQPGFVSSSFIQLWQNEKLQLDQIRQLGWNNPPVELLVLSACRTAVGDRSAELGFAGLAIATGAKSALASLWYVSDAGTLGLMTEFYTYLHNSTIKAEALRQAQLAMLRGNVSIEGGELRGSEQQRGGLVLPPEISEEEGDRNFSHPFYWSGFTLVGSPW